ncbi:MAG: hypothetical protein ACP5FZ_01375 [Fidelibacterota bacterium]
MKRSFPIICLICGFLSTTLERCGENIEDPDPPTAPHWVAPTEPAVSRGRGIRPYNEGDGIILEWHPNPEEDLSGYKLYRAAYTELDESEGEFTLIADINAFSLGGTDTSYIDDLVQFSIDYYYYLRAYDQAGNKSISSDTIWFSLIPKTDPLTPIGQLSAPPVNFEWYDNTNSASEYIIFLETVAPRNDIWISRFSRPNYGDSFQSKPFNFDGYAEALISGQNYRWCVKAIVYIDNFGNMWRGSISNWAYFSLE